MSVRGRIHTKTSAVEENSTERHQYLNNIASWRKKIEYSNGELTIVWQPELCRHSGICVHTLPAVYNPKERPWVKIENATNEQLMAQIKMCPSEALSYRMEHKE